MLVFVPCGTAGDGTILVVLNCCVVYACRCWLQPSQEVVAEVYGLLQERNLDWQQLRTLVRQLQQAQQQQQQQQQAQSQQQLSGSSSSSSDGDGWSVAAGSSRTTAAAEGGVAVPDPEVQQLMLELAGKQQQPTKQGKAAKQGKSPSTLARRSIRNMLKPLATALHAASAAE
jgi:hypothetical protein